MGCQLFGVQRIQGSVVGFQGLHKAGVVPRLVGLVGQSVVGLVPFLQEWGGGAGEGSGGEGFGWIEWEVLRDYVNRCRSR